MQTRAALLGYSVGLPALILVKILAPGFYARQVMSTPVKIAFATVLITQTLAILFAWPLGLGHAGLTLATSIGACFNAGLLLWLLLRRGYYRPQPGWLSFFAKVCVGRGVARRRDRVVDGRRHYVAWRLASLYKIGRLGLVVRGRRVRLFRNAVRARVPAIAVQPARGGDADAHSADG